MFTACLTGMAAHKRKYEVQQLVLIPEIGQRKDMKRIERRVRARENWKIGKQKRGDEEKNESENELLFDQSSREHFTLRHETCDMQEGKKGKSSLEVIQLLN